MWYLASATSPDASNPLVAYGLLGIILVAVVFLWLSGKVVSGREYDRVIAENTEMRQKMPDAITAQQASTEAMKEMGIVMRDAMVALEVARQTAKRTPRS